MAPVNAVVVPPQWFSFSIFFIEIFTIILPCWQVIKTHNLRQETLDAIASWEEKNRSLDTDPDWVSTAVYSGSTFRASTLSAPVANKSNKSRSGTSTSIKNSCRNDMLTMVALENALRTNPKPLLEFAALRDFSGENVSFLTHVAEWKRAIAATGSQRATGSNDNQQHFIRATQVYSHFVSLDLSEFPINISSRAAKELFDVFDCAAKALYGRRRSEQSDLSSATPFDDLSLGDSTVNLNSKQSGPAGLENTLGKANLRSVVQMSELATSDADSSVPELLIPIAFSPKIFDMAETEIKHLVLTNTWPKFVRSTAGGDRQSHKEKTHIIRMGKMFCGLGETA